MKLSFVAYPPLVFNAVNVALILCSYPPIVFIAANVVYVATLPRSIP